MKAALGSMAVAALVFSFLPFQQAYGAQAKPKKPTETPEERAARELAEKIADKVAEKAGSSEFADFESITGIFLLLEPDEKAGKASKDPGDQGTQVDTPFPKIIGTVAKSPKLYKIVVQTPANLAVLSKYEKKTLAIRGRTLFQDGRSTVFLFDSLDNGTDGVDAPVMHRKRGSPL